MTDVAQQTAQAQSPVSTEEAGLYYFLSMERMASRTPRAFTASLLSPEELDRVRALMWGPQRPLALDRRLKNLGLAKVVLGKVVATRASWEAIWKEG